MLNRKWPVAGVGRCAVVPVGVMAAPVSPVLRTRVAGSMDAAEAAAAVALPEAAVALVEALVADVAAAVADALALVA